MPSKYSFILAPNADEDIESALDYIAYNLYNKKAAIDLKKEIDKAIDTICEFPFSSSNCECFLIEDKNTRHIPIKNYTLIYEINECKKELYILYFRYSRMDLKNIVSKRIE